MPFSKVFNVRLEPDHVSTLHQLKAYFGVTTLSEAMRAMIDRLPANESHERHPPELEPDMNEKIYTITDAAEYLGIGRGTLKFHIETGHITPDQQLSSGYIFRQATLDHFRHHYRNQEWYTKSEAAAYLGVSENWIKHRLYGTGELQPDGKRGWAVVFKPATLDALRHLTNKPPGRVPKKG